MEFDLRDLRYFQCIAEVGHLGRAAERLGRSQPALTKCIRRLENQLDAPLFERKGRGLKLTPVGETLLIQARRLRGAADNSLREIQEFARGSAGRVRLGCGPITADTLLPSICDLILTKGAGITLELTIGMNYDLREKIRRGDIDVIVGLVTEHDSNEQFLAKPMMDDVVVVAADESHTIFHNPNPRLEDLLEFSWVLPITQVASRQWLDVVFASRGLPRPSARIEANSIPMLPGAREGKELLYFVSRHTIARRAAEGLKEVRLEATTLRRQLGLIYPRSTLVPAVSRIIDVLGRELGPTVATANLAKPNPTGAPTAELEAARAHRPERDPITA
jgi:DNA-binding transcriptional LysR family regulator